MTRTLAAVLLCLAALPAAAEESDPSFDLVVRAPDAVRELLEKHLELRRYREVADLDDAEIARLVVLAERNARELLATQGYFSPQVRIERESRPRTTLVVTVDPGPAAQVDGVQIEFTGDIATSTDEAAVAQRDAIRRDWALPAGQGFTQDRWDAAKSQATRALLAKRYPAGRIADSTADVDAATHSARLGLKLDSGAVFHLGGLRVAGVERYDPELVPRLARLPPGMVYDQEKILQAQLRLAGSGYFDSAFLFVDPDSDPAAAPLHVTVREAALQKVVLGVGFTTDGGPRASVEHIHNRVPGIGWRAVSKVLAEKKNPSAQTEWTAVPDVAGWRWAVLARAERLDDDKLVTNGARLRAGRLRDDDHIERNTYVQYERVTEQSDTGLSPLETGVGAAISANFIWTGRYFDNIPYPTRGFGFAFELGAGYTLTSDRKPFARGVARWMGYRPIGTGRVQLRAEGGAVFASSQAQVPATQLFRTGGDATVRGYKFLEIGIPLREGVVGPGRYKAVGSVEWQRPILRGGRPSDLESLVFADVGAVADRAGDLRANWGAGAGVRWKSPVGPVDVALAYGFEKRALRLHFTAGFVF
jgi:translocation and assembly module TamA